ncbi:hypothetical protein D8674_038878 [Pyrus ussuriensis x Pyrus communis]|uniref:DOG1 domain-containing protein n=1 Tax=Pyrus ussuriensis x Pyrus communis TaxID=2448454 RepID=A0A5N5H6J0_9ROSA|nr:hypothetical protein D8674_038878 [Pyrus ussuriensis x Pyrus communis]
MAHYAEYYRVKSLATERDTLFVFVAPSATTLERSLYWIGGWRPTTAFHLIYSESSIHFEFGRVSELQCETVKEGNAISEQLSEWQAGAFEMIGACTNLDMNMGSLVSVLKTADDLRLRKVGKVVKPLTPQQAVEVLIAAAELQFGVRGWRMNQDRRHGNV